MTLRWRRTTDQPRDTGPSAATLSRKRAEKELERVRAETPRYRELAESLRQIREHNNFAAAIASTFQGGDL